ncbi:MAG: hypothetical protein RL748_4473 [Pseudomonadota bacterium]|jgi:hypothetical protein
MEPSNLQQYFRNQQVSTQWLPILQALALELAERADVADLRQLFTQVGARFAIDVEQRFLEVQTLAALEQGLNEFWQSMNWGWVSLQEAKANVEIYHYAAPLAQAFGDEQLEWSVGLLEGFYQHVFKTLGAGDAMQVEAVGGDGMDLQFRFGR